MQRKHWKSSIAFWLMAAMSFTSARAQEAKQPEQAATPAIKKTAINLWPGVALGTRLRVSSR